MALTAVGAAIGLAGATVMTALSQSLLYEVAPFDGFTLLSVLGLVSAVAMAVIVHPALRAARTDPAAVLRAE